MMISQVLVCLGLSDSVLVHCFNELRLLHGESQLS